MEELFAPVRAVAGLAGVPTRCGRDRPAAQRCGSPPERTTGRLRGRHDQRRREYSAMHPRELPPCDLVMKGGVTSGVVYPGAVLELSSTFRFANVGGTSAGAIAAAMTAAAEFDRQRSGRMELGGIEEIVAEIGQPGSRSRSLFQPMPEARELFTLALSLGSAGRSRARRFRAVVSAVLRHRPAAALTLAGVVLLLCRPRGRRSGTCRLRSSSCSSYLARSGCCCSRRGRCSARSARWPASCGARCPRTASGSVRDTRRPRRPRRTRRVASTRHPALRRIAARAAAHVRDAGAGWDRPADGGHRPRPGPAGADPVRGGAVPVLTRRGCPDVPRASSSPTSSTPRACRPTSGAARGPGSCPARSCRSWSAPG